MIFIIELFVGVFFIFKCYKVNFGIFIFEKKYNENINIVTEIIVSVWNSFENVFKLVMGIDLLKVNIRVK